MRDGGQQDSDYSSTVPAQLDDETLQATLASNLADDTPMEYVLIGAISTGLAAPLAHLRQALASLVATGGLTLQQAQPMNDAMEAAEKIQLQTLLINQLGSQNVRHAHTQVDLNKIVDAALDDVTVPLRQRGIELYRSIKPVAVIVDPDLVAALVTAAIDWASAIGRRLVVSLEIKHWPEHGILRLKSTQPSKTGHSQLSNQEQNETLSWYLVRDIAAAIGAMVDRVEAPEETVLTIEFLRTVRQLEGLSAIEIDFDHDSGSGTPSQVLAGHRVLIISSDVRLREEAKALCRSMGLIVDSVPSSLMAHRACQTDPPDLIIVDERFRDEKFDELRNGLLRAQPNFPFIEIAYDSNALSMAGWMGGDTMTRINRAEMATELPHALTMEMAKVL